jgi:hypothetical protein
MQSKAFGALFNRDPRLKPAFGEDVNAIVSHDFAGYYGPTAGTEKSTIIGLIVRA